MSKKLRHIIENELDWVKDVNEYDNFFNWFRGGPGRWIGRDIEWWITHVQNVEYAMSAIHMDLQEMLNFADKMDDGDVDAETMMDLAGGIQEYVTLRNGRNDIEDYISDIKSFIKEFRQYFGEDMLVSDMVSSVIEVIQYAKENNINIHEKGTSMNEDFDWAINDTVPFLEIGEPLSVQQPKNKYRLHVTHGVGEEHGTWIPNWINYDPTDSNSLDTLIRHTKILNHMNLRGDGWGLADLWLQGEEWVLSSEDNKSIKEFMETENLTIEDTTGEIRDHIFEWLDEELMDYGLREIDTYHQEDATVEDWKVTYFDEFGIEHAVKVNLPRT